MFMGRDTHFAKYYKHFDFLRKDNRSIKSPQFREIFFYNSGRPGDHAPFLETPGNSGRLGRSGCESADTLTDSQPDKNF